MAFDQKAYLKKYRAENKEKIAAKNKEWRDNNPNHKANWVKENKRAVKEYHKKYHAENKEKRAEYNKEWNKSNKERSNSITQKRRARQLGNGTFIVSERFIKNLYNSPCRFCGGSDKIEADHILPISRGGRHSEGNLQPLCKSCNSSKGPKLWIAFVAEKRVA